MIGMPGCSYKGELPPLTAEETKIRERAGKHIRVLAGEIGERNIWKYKAYASAALYIETAFTDLGYAPQRETFRVDQVAVHNVVAEKTGTTLADEIVVVGAHYDTVEGSPGANDNATGVAGMLEIARLLRPQTLDRTVRFAAFANEEAPFYQTGDMGSMVHAKEARERGDRIVAMLSIETIGFYDDTPGSQHYPPGLSAIYPDRANFICFVSNVSSGRLVRRSIGSFRRYTQFPSEGIAAPDLIPGIGWSDHQAFWEQGYKAFMVTDTALYRYPAYHRAEDKPDRVDYDRTARVIAGLARVVIDLALK